MITIIKHTHTHTRTHIHTYNNTNNNNVFVCFLHAGVPIMPENRLVELLQQVTSFNFL